MDAPVLRRRNAHALAPAGNADIAETAFFLEPGATSRFNKADPFESVYETPGWQRARAQQSSRKSAGPLTIEGDLVARSVDLGNDRSAFSVGERVFHLKFGYGAITNIEGNKLSIDFEKAGAKKVLESFIKKG
jgi:DNA helicase-2/ATP-dependent DNA helicase PcrA